MKHFLTILLLAAGVCAQAQTPEWTILCNGEEITDVLDWGEVVYDDSWGTEYNPYEEAKTLQISTGNVDDPITLRVQNGQVFELFTETLPAKGGKATIQFSTKNKGTYKDSLFITIAQTTVGIELRAKAVTKQDIRPTIQLSTRDIYLNPNLYNDMDDMAEMTFSVDKLQKPLYIKWEKGEIPSWQGCETTILAGNEAEEVYFGSATNMGTATRTEESILINAIAFQPGTFVSSLCFYTYNEDKELAFEQRVTITIFVDNEYRPVTGMGKVKDAGCTMQDGKYLIGGQFVIIRNNTRYNIFGD